MPLSGLPIIVMTVLYTSRENKLSYSAPVHAEAARFTCANQAFLPPSPFTLNFTGANQAFLSPSPFTLNFTGANRGFLPPSLKHRVQIRPFCHRRPSLILSRTTARARSAQGASQFAAGYAADTTRATSKLQIIRLLTKFRVKKTTTLKTPKRLLHSVLQVAPNVSVTFSRTRHQNPAGRLMTTF